MKTANFVDISKTFNKKTIKNKEKQRKRLII